MTLLPFWALRFFRAAIQLSDWIDEKLFPLPATPLERRQLHLQDVEDCSQMIRRQIEKCRCLQDTYDAADAIRDFKVIWGDTVQVNACADSLNLALYNKQNSIINSL